MNKKMLPLVGLVLVLLVGAGAYGVYRLKNRPAATPTETGKKKIEEPINAIPVEERPYIQIAPVGDGRNIHLIIKSLQKPAEEVDYELEYQAGTLLQGAFGVIELESIPSQTTILLGSCSAGGACTYHEDVQGGKLLTRFRGPENYALRSDWKYIDNKDGATGVSSKDAKFQLESDEVAGLRYIIIFNTAGYPEGLEGTPVSDPYSLAASTELEGSGTLTMRANEEGELVVMGWDGSEWHEFTGEVEGKMITAEVDLMELYIAVKK